MTNSRLEVTPGTNLFVDGMSASPDFEKSQKQKIPRIKSDRLG